MNIEELCNFRDRIGDLVDSHVDDLQDAFEACDSNEDSTKIRKEYEEKVNPDHQLHIGIVGRVKAGKSSLLNSLFFNGKDVLPKAATPMTAALTKLYYSEKLTIKINFFEQDDLDGLKKASEKYDVILKGKIEEIYKKQVALAEKRSGGKKISSLEEKELRNKSERLAISDIKENKLMLAGAAEQYQLIKKAPKEVLEHLGNPIIEYPEQISDIGNKLADYVGANGKYTAITSNVEIGFPNETLRDITVVDTPGFDDPVPSRDTLARESLKVCDAIFVLSPSGNFCNEQDKSNISKIEKGEGIQEIYIVASRIDDDLGNEFNTGDIQEELNNIVESISGTLNSMLDSMISVGDLSSSLFKKLKDNSGTNLLYTSGICQSLYETWDDKDNWHDEALDVWNRLKDTYPDLFGSEDESAKELLRIIGNVDVIQKKIEEVKNRKEEILLNRENEFLSAKYQTLTDIMNSLILQLNDKKEDVEKSDMTVLEEAQKKQGENFNNLHAEFIDVFDDQIFSFVLDSKNLLEQTVDSAYQDAVSKLNSAESSKTEQIKTSGIGGWWKRLWGTGGYESITVTTVNAHTVTSAIKEIAKEVGDILENQAEELRLPFKSKLKSAMLDVWSNYQIADFCSSSSRSSQAMQIVNKMPEISFSIDWELPSSINRNGTLEDTDAERFIDLAGDVLRDIKSEYKNSVKDFANEVKTGMNPTDMADLVLEKMKKNLEKMTEDVKNKKQTLDRYERISKELLNLKKEIES